MHGQKESTSAVAGESIGNLSKTAYDMFINASMDCPNSVTAQSAWLAKQCIERGLNPEELSSALLADPSRLETIAQIANKKHSQTNKGPQVTPEIVSQIIGSDFRRAKYFLKADPYLLGRIACGDIYKKNFLDSPFTGEQREEKFSMFVEDALISDRPYMNYNEYEIRKSSD